ncbi:MAG: arsenic resistance N-acetyltransferase ArsN2 [Minicystis sp.]
MITVLFACIHNAGRSQMAAAWFNALSDPAKARAVSAGTAPGPRVHPEVLEAMREVGIDLASVKPQMLTDELAGGAALLVTMGCGEACPVVPGLRRTDWPLEDPKGKPIERVREIREEVRGLVAALIAAEGWGASVTIAPAMPRDADAVRRLLVEAELPAEGLLDQFPAAYVVARSGGVIVGVAGLETYGTTGLLRSVAVAPPHRRGGTGRALVTDRLAAARANGLEAVYLLTTSAADYFRRLGFSPAAREQVPVDLAASPEFAGVCPASATCLVLYVER